MRIHITKSFALAGLLALTTSAGLAQVMSSTNPNPACASLQLWLRADQGVAADGAGSVVTAWTNQATSAAAVGNATAAIIGAGSGPTLDGGSAVLNGQPALAFDGASEGLDLTNNAADLLAGGLYTVFIVLYDAGPNTTWHQFQMLMGNNYNTVYLYAIDPWAGSQYNDQFDIQSGSPSWSSVDSSGCITNDDPYLLTAVAAGTSAGATRLYVDGTENDSGAAMPAFNLNSDWYIGYDPGNSSRWFAGEIAEILIYQGALANTDIGAIDAYLGNKYNISVPLPVASSPTFYPQAGTYFGAQSITLTAGSGSTIYYTTNGTTPTPTSPSGASPLVVAVPIDMTNFTITAYAVETGYSNSVASSATYTTETVTANGTQVMLSSSPNPAYTNLQLWLRADQGVALDTDGTTVTTWANQCTSTNAVGDADDSVITTGAYGVGPTLATASSTLNGMPVLDFDGVTNGLDILNSGALLANNSYTVFMVLQPNGTWPWPYWNGYEVLLANNSANLALVTDGSVWLGSQYGTYFQLQSNNGWDSAATPHDLPGTEMLVEARADGTNTFLYLDGTDQNGDGTALGALNLSSDWSLGWQSSYAGSDTGGANTGRWFNGQIAEVLVYQGNLSVVDVDNINNYLGSKYNLAVALPVATAPTFYPPAGTYIGTQSITLTASSGATIYYSTNGTTPTAASPSGASPLVVAVPANETNFRITAYAAETGYSNSLVSSAVYSTQTSTVDGIRVMSGSSPNSAYTNLQLWLRADQGIALNGNGTAVTAWTNQATSAAAVGNASDSLITSGSQGVTGSGPTFEASSSTLNQMPALEFDGITNGLDILYSSTLMANNSFTMFMVVQPNGTWPWPYWNGYEVLLANNSANFALATDGGVWLGSQYGTYFQLQSNNGWGSAATPHSLAGTEMLLEAAADGTNTFLDIDGVDQNGSGTTLGALNLNSDWSLGWQWSYVGSDSSGGNTGRWFNGQIAELLVYQGTLSALDVGNINSYLGAKYDLSVPAPLPPSLNYAQAGPVLTFTWQGAFKLQACTNLASGTWADIPGGTASGATTTNNPATPAMFFRLSQ
jgi:hypothetical protein